MRPPKPGLQNVLCATSQLSYLSSTAHELSPDRTFPPAHVHAASGHFLATADSHVRIHAQGRSVTVPQRLHFRPIDIALRDIGSFVTVVIAGADGAWYTVINSSNAGESTEQVLSTLPGSRGYAIVSLAINDDYVAAAAVDGRVAIWRDLHAPADLIFDNVPLSGDRITNMKFVKGGLLIAWWSGRLVFQELRTSENSVVWTMDAVCVSKTVFGGFSGSFLVVKGDVVVLATGRGDLVFVRIADGAYFKSSVGKYVKGLCEHDDRLHLVVDGKLVTRDLMSEEELDKLGVMTSVISRKAKSNREKDVSNMGKQG